VTVGGAGVTVFGAAAAVMIGGTGMAVQVSDTREHQAPERHWFTVPPEQVPG
jgi:hypothetical protein